MINSYFCNLSPVLHAEHLDLGTDGYFIHINKLPVLGTSGLILGSDLGTNGLIID